MPKPKRFPIRTCVACRQTDQKRELLRVVRQPDGVVAYDARGKAPGRGAYVCSSAACIGQARKQRKFQRSLKVESVPEELFQDLMAIALPAGEAGDGDSAGD